MWFNSKSNIFYRNSYCMLFNWCFFGRLLFFLNTSVVFEGYCQTIVATIYLAVTAFLVTFEVEKSCHESTTKYAFELTFCLFFGVMFFQVTQDGFSVGRDPCFAQMALRDSLHLFVV